MLAVLAVEFTTRRRYLPHWTEGSAFHPLGGSVGRDLATASDSVMSNDTTASHPVRPRTPDRRRRPATPVHARHNHHGRRLTLTMRSHRRDPPKIRGAESKKRIASNKTQRFFDTHAFFPPRFGNPAGPHPDPARPKLPPLRPRTVAKPSENSRAGLQSGRAGF